LTKLDHSKRQLKKLIVVGYLSFVSIIFIRHNKLWKFNLFFVQKEELRLYI